MTPALILTLAALILFALAVWMGRESKQCSLEKGLGWVLGSVVAYLLSAVAALIAALRMLP